MKAVLYTQNSSAQTITTDSALAVGSVVRRTGCAIRSTNNSVVLKKPGYYSVTAFDTFTANAAGGVTISIVQDGEIIASSAQTAASGDIITLSVQAVVRAENACCPCSQSSIQVIVNGATVGQTTVTTSIIVEEV